MPKIKVTLSIGYPTAQHEDILDVDETEWSECETEIDQQNLMDEYWRDWSNNYIEGGAELVDN